MELTDEQLKWFITKLAKCESCNGVGCHRSSEFGPRDCKSCNGSGLDQKVYTIFPDLFIKK